MVTVDPSVLILQAPPAPWDELIRRSAALLERRGVITPAYVEAIFASLERNGAYMLIAPNVLLAHARPEEGALGTGLSLISTREPVLLQGDPACPIRLFFTLAGNDDAEHLGLLSCLAETLTDDALLDELMTSADPARVAQVLTPPAPAGGRAPLPPPGALP